VLMQTSSLPAGTAPVDQLPPSCQMPPEAPIQLSVQPAAAFPLTARTARAAPPVLAPTEVATTPPTRVHATVLSKRRMNTPSVGASPVQHNRGRRPTSLPC